MKERYKSINIETTFQSRFGLKNGLPYTDKTLENCPRYKKVLVICPGFASDCVETLEEIDIQGEKVFSQGGKILTLFHVLTIIRIILNYLKLVTKYI